MPNRISDDKVRKTYTEWRDTYDTLQAYADVHRLDFSLVVRKATLDFAERIREEDPKLKEHLAKRDAAAASKRTKKPR